MKKISLLLMVLALFGTSAFAQSRVINQQTNVKPANVAKAQDVVFDKSREVECVLWTNLADCDTPFVYYSFDVVAPDDSGFITGHNAYLDKAKAEKFEGLPGDSLTGLTMWFAEAAAPSNVAKITVTVWDDNGASGAPGTVLASKQISIKSIQNNINDTATLGFVTTYFNKAIANPGTFYAGFSMTYAGGVFSPTTYCVLVNAAVEGCNEIDENSGYEQWSNNQWFSMIDVYGAGFKLAVFPEICSEVAACDISITPSSATVCKNKTVTLTASGATTYSWAPSDGLNTTVGPTVIAKPSSTTTYTVTGDGGVCTETVTVTVNALPKNLSVTQDPCSNGAVLLTANSNPSTGVKYKWFLNGVKITGATQKTYSATASGAYKAEITITATGCKKKTPEVNVTVNCKMAEGMNSAFNVEAYPNPFVNSISVTLNSASSEAGTITVSDFSGRVIREYTNIDPTTPFEIKEEMASGVYFLNVTQGANTKMIKVVKND